MKNIVSGIAFIFSFASSYSQPLSADTLHWSESRKLEWKDFSGKPSGKAGRVTMVMNAKFHKGLKATTSVETVFDRKASYVSPEEQSASVLKYYQTLFDLYEAESRKLRKQFKETRFGMDPEKVFQEKYKAALAELSERNDQYMEETETGTNLSEVERWSKTIQQEIKGLESFK